MAKPFKKTLDGAAGDGKETQFKPGQSGNPGGRPKLKAFTEALRRALKINAETGESEELTAVAESLIKAAKDGDVVAIRELADRIEGKVPQGIVGDPEAPLQVKINLG